LISGQSWAFYQAYDMAGQMDLMSVKTSQPATIDMHQGHNTETMDHQNMNADDGMDCCQVSYDCQCPPSACSVINVLVTQFNMGLSVSPTSIEHIFLDKLHSNKFYSPPYRPPIV